VRTCREAEVVKISSIYQHLQCLLGSHSWVTYSQPLEVHYREGCCAHGGMDQGHCWDCYDTGHTHSPEEPCDTSMRFTVKRCTECRYSMYSAQ
jgi:hypothetical protein